MSTRIHALRQKYLLFNRWLVRNVGFFDIDPEFSNTEEWWLSIPEEVRPHKDQPFYHLLAENSESEYVAYVSEQNLLPDDSDEPIRHSQVAEIFVKDKSGGKWGLFRGIRL